MCYLNLFLLGGLYVLGCSWFVNLSTDVSYGFSDGKTALTKTSNYAGKHKRRKNTTNSYIHVLCFIWKNDFFTRAVRDLIFPLHRVSLRSAVLTVMTHKSGKDQSCRSEYDPAKSDPFVWH